MNKSLEIGKLAEALAKAQASIKPPAKNKKVRVTSARGSYEFTYSTLDALIESVRVPFSSNGLSFSQGVARIDGSLVLVTMLMHTSGEWISNTVPLEVQQPGMQQLGSAISYARRYGLGDIAGVVAEEDDDANSADGNRVVNSGEDTSAPTVKPPSTTNLLRKLGKVMKDRGISADSLPGKVNPRALTELELVSLIETLEEESSIHTPQEN